MDRWRAAGALVALAACIASSAAAPTSSNQTALDVYDGAPEGCYYNFQHYGEGDRIMTNEPCLNCTCHNRMLMCYLRVCPFTKAIGQDCTVEKRADQCCPIVTCPDVPVDLLTSTSTTSPAEYGATGLGKLDKYGCSINGKYFPEGSKVPPTPNKPCEHCYCIRNMTTCVMQECTLHVDGCTPIYHKDVCCPVRYSCDHPEDEIPLLDDMTTTVRPTPGFLLTTTTVSPVTQMTQDCVHDDQIFPDGALIKTEKACEHCYCMKGDIVCVVQECGTPMENEGKNCTSLPPREGQCCPDTYICEGDGELSSETPFEITTQDIGEMTTIAPPRRVAEGSGYRNEPDDSPHVESTTPESHIEGSGEEQSLHGINENEQELEVHNESTTLLTEVESISTSTKPSLMEEIEEQTTAIDLSKVNDISTEDNLKEDVTNVYSPSTTDVPRLEEVEKSTAEPMEIHGTISEKESSELDQLIPVATTAASLKEPEQDTTETYDAQGLTTKIIETEAEDVNTKDQLSSTLPPATEFDEGQHFEANDISVPETSEPEEFTQITTTKSLIDDIEPTPTKQTEQGAVSENDILKQDDTSTDIPILEDSDIYTTETTQDQDIITSFIPEKENIEPEQFIPVTTSVPKLEESSQSNIIPDRASDSDLDEFIPISTSVPGLEEISKLTSEPKTEIITSTTSNIIPLEETTLGSIEKQDSTPATATENIISQTELHVPRTTINPETQESESVTSLPGEDQNIIPDIQATSGPTSEYESNTESQPTPHSSTTESSSKISSVDETTPVVPKATDSLTFPDEKEITKTEYPSAEYDLSTPTLPKEEQTIMTTEATLRKEDSGEPSDVQKQTELATESGTAATLQPEKQTKPTITMNEETEPTLPTLQDKEPTETLSSSTQSQNELETAYTIPTTEKVDSIETTTINIGDNEIDEESAIPPGRIPGEGDCLVDGITYRNESVVPSTNKCHTSCKCFSSIIKCDPIICSPPPEYMNNCQSIYDSPESCCPTYVCDHSRETVPPESQSQMSGTEKPVPSPSIECHGDQCEIVKGETMPTIGDQASAVRPCEGEDCDTTTDKAMVSDIPEVSEKQCDGDTCDTTVGKEPISEIHTPEIPDKSCEGDGCDIKPDDAPELPEESSKPCEGESCDTATDKAPASENPQEHTEPCKGDNCDIISDKTSAPETQEKPVIPCEGENCDEMFDQAQKPEDTKKTEGQCEGKGCEDTPDRAPITEIPEKSTLPCEGDNCRTVPDATTVLEVPTKPLKPCEGDDCGTELDKDQSPQVPKETVKPCEGIGCEISTTIPEVSEPIEPCEGDSCISLTDHTPALQIPKEPVEPCLGDDCKSTSDITPITEIPDKSMEPCEGDSCTLHKAPIPEMSIEPGKPCEEDACDITTDKIDIPEVLIKPVKTCIGDSCDATSEQAPLPEINEGKPCKGDVCESTSDKTPIHDIEEHSETVCEGDGCDVTSPSLIPDFTEEPPKECKGEGCVTSDMILIPEVQEEPIKPCDGDACEFSPDKVNIPDEPEKSVKPCEGDDCGAKPSEVPIPETLEDSEKPCEGDCDTTSNKTPISDGTLGPVTTCEGDNCGTTQDKTHIPDDIETPVQVCEGVDCVPTTDKAQLPELIDEPVKPCEGDSCDATSDKTTPENADEPVKACEGDVCDTSSDITPIPEVIQESVKPCAGDDCGAKPSEVPVPETLEDVEKPCEGAGCEGILLETTEHEIPEKPFEPCEGEGCTTIDKLSDTPQIKDEGICTKESGCEKPEIYEPVCVGISCRRQDSPNVESQEPFKCTGIDCPPEAQTEHPQYTHDIETSTSLIDGAVDKTQELPSSEKSTEKPTNDKDMTLTSTPSIIESPEMTPAPEVSLATTKDEYLIQPTDSALTDSSDEKDTTQEPIQQNTVSLTEEENQTSQDVKPEETGTTNLPENDIIGTQAPDQDSTKLQDASTENISKPSSTELPFVDETDIEFDKTTDKSELTTENIVTESADLEKPKPTETPIDDEIQETHTEIIPELVSKEELSTKSPDQALDQDTTLPDSDKNVQPDFSITESPESPATESEVSIPDLQNIKPQLPEADAVQDLNTEKESMPTSEIPEYNPNVKVTEASVTESNEYSTVSNEQDLVASEVTGPTTLGPEDISKVHPVADSQEQSTIIPDLPDTHQVLHETVGPISTETETEIPVVEPELVDINKPEIQEDKPILTDNETPEQEPERLSTVAPDTEVPVTESKVHVDTEPELPEVTESLDEITSPKPIFDENKPEEGPADDYSKRTELPELYSTESGVTASPVTITGSEMKKDQTTQKEIQATGAPIFSANEQEPLGQTIGHKEPGADQPVTEILHIDADITTHPTDSSGSEPEEINTKETFIPNLGDYSTDNPQEYITEKTSVPESERPTTEQYIPIKHDEASTVPTTEVKYATKESITEMYELTTKSSNVITVETDLPEHDTTNAHKVVTETPEQTVTDLLEPVTKISGSDFGLSETDTPSTAIHETNDFTESPKDTDGRRTETPLSLVTQTTDIEGTNQDSNTKQPETSVTKKIPPQEDVTKSPDTSQVMETEQQTETSAPVSSVTNIELDETVVAEKERVTTEKSKYESETKTPQISGEKAELVPVTETHSVPVESDQTSTPPLESEQNEVATEPMQDTTIEEDKTKLTTTSSIPIYKDTEPVDSNATEKPLETGTEIPELQHKVTIPDYLETTEYTIIGKPVSDSDIEKDEENTELPVQLTTEKPETEFTTMQDDDKTIQGIPSSIPEHVDTNLIQSEIPAEPTEKVTTSLPEMEATSVPKYETTPYLIELEEHPHIIIDESSSTLTPYDDDIIKSSEQDQPVTELLSDKVPMSGLEETTERQDETRLTADAESNTEGQPISVGPNEVNDITTQPSIVTESIPSVSDHSSETELDTRYSDDNTPPVIELEKTTLTVPTSTVSSTQDSGLNAQTDLDKEEPVKPEVPIEIDTPEREKISTSTKASTKYEEPASSTSAPFDKYTKPEDKIVETVPSTATPEIPKPSELPPTEEIASPEDGSHDTPSGTSGYGQEPDYFEEDQTFGPGTCRYGGKVYVSAQQIPRDDPCDFCFCFRSDIICLQQSCPPPIHGCHEEPIQGFCCPRYECPVSMATTLNVTTTTTTTTTTLPPNFPTHSYKGAAQRRGCQIKGHTYKVGEVVRASSGPCLHCTCGGDGQMKCDPKACTPEPMLRQMIAAAVSAKRRR